MLECLCVHGAGDVVTNQNLLNFILTRIHLRWLAFVCAIFPGRNALAQWSAEDSSFYQQSLHTLDAVYRSRVRNNLRIYSGNEYSQYGLQAKGHPYFQADSLSPGDIFYDGTLYHAVSMRYDLVYDNIILNDYSGSYPIRVVAQKVGWFQLYGHRFVPFRPDSTESAGKAPGFFDLLYEDSISHAYVKRQKKLQMPLDPNDNIPAYREYDTYYLTVRNSIYTLGTVRELLNIYRDQKDALKKFAKGNNINLRDISDETLTRMLVYYSSLKK